MRASQLIKVLEEHPEAEVFLYDSETEDRIPLGSARVTEHSADDYNAPIVVLHPEA